MSDFTIHHLRFTAQVLTTIEMGEFKGSALRGAWQSHLRTLYCARGDTTDPLHQSLCPVCYLLSREADPSDNRRPYAFEPPLTPQTLFRPGDEFNFGITIFGHAVQFLPYIVLSVQQMGEVQGLGRPSNEPIGGQPSNEPIGGRPIHAGKRRGTFKLLRIDEVNRLTGEAETLYQAGNPTIQMPQHPVTAEWVALYSARLAEELAARGNLLTLEFLTPTRIIQGERLVHQPEFAPLLARLVDRVSTLRVQFADRQVLIHRTDKMRIKTCLESPPVTYEEKGALMALAAKVERESDQTHWWDVKGLSTRLGRPQPLGGFVGRVTYRAGNWGPLLPWLIWGASTHVGKNAVKGGGWYRLSSPPPPDPTNVWDKR
jgi:hypothetical protein